MAITGPIALFNNLPIEPQYYQPWNFDISGITLGNPTVITLVIPAITYLGYVVGQQIRLLIPPTFGCRQLNGQTGYVLAVTPPNQITVDINSSVNVDPYIVSSATTPAQCTAIGDVNSGQISSTGLSIPLVAVPGAFINVSPN